MRRARSKRTTLARELRRQSVLGREAACEMLPCRNRSSRRAPRPASFQPRRRGAARSAGARARASPRGNSRPSTSSQARNRSSHAAVCWRRSHSSSPTVPVRSPSSSDVFHSSRAGSPSNARQPAGVSSTVTPSRRSSYAISADEACKPPRTHRYRSGDWAGSVWADDVDLGPDADDERQVPGGEAAVHARIDP